MEDFLRSQLPELEDAYTHWEYREDLATSGSFIHRVGVLSAVDNNKCDWAYILIGTQRHQHATPELKGKFYFKRGENDDMGSVLARAFSLIPEMHLAFEE